jgi:hypothetical protein
MTTDYSAPTDYGSSHMKVDPQALSAYANNDLPHNIHNFSACIWKIDEIWQGLKLGWVGKTQQEADDFNQRWHACSVALFGQEHKTSDGSPDTSYPPPGENVLGKIAAALSAVADNFAAAQGTVKKMFESYQDTAPGTPPAPPSGSVPSDVVKL